MYTTKLKNYCSSLKILKKKVITHLNYPKHQKLNESSSPVIKNAKKDIIGKEKPKNHGPTFIIKDFKDKENSSSKNKAYIQNGIRVMNKYLFPSLFRRYLFGNFLVQLSLL